MADPNQKANYEKELQQMLEQDPMNRQCADCGANGPRWASYNLGVFLCIRCGGLHRRLGTHISKVKSITLDGWTSAQYDNMRQWGNVKANAHYIPQPEAFRCPIDSDTDMEQYIRDKYERKQFQNPDTSKSKFKLAHAVRRQSGPGLSNGNTNNINARVAATNPAPFAAAAPSTNGGGGGEYAHKVASLRKMGFHNHELALKALYKYRGDITQAVEWLVTQPNSTIANPNSNQQQSFAPPVNGNQTQVQQQQQPQQQQSAQFAPFGQFQQPSQQQQQQQFSQSQQQQQQYQQPQRLQQAQPANNDLFGLFDSVQPGQQQQQSQQAFPQATQLPAQPQQQQPQQQQPKSAAQDLAQVFSSDPAEKVTNSKQAILSLYAQQQPSFTMPTQQQQQPFNPMYTATQLPYQQAQYQIQPQQQVQMYGGALAQTQPRGVPQQMQGFVPSLNQQQFPGPQQQFPTGAQNQFGGQQQFFINPQQNNSGPGFQQLPPTMQPQFGNFQQQPNPFQQQQQQPKPFQQQQPQQIQQQPTQNGANFFFN